MKAIVHIGLKKTGSKTLQRTLARNAAGLGAQGFAYDPDLRPDWSDSQLDLAIVAHAFAGRCLPEQLPRIRADLPDLAAHKARANVFGKKLSASVGDSDAETMLLSCEHVGQFTTEPPLAQALDAWLSDYFDDVSYVMYLRPQHEWLLSLYSEHLRAGGTQELATFVRTNAASDYRAFIAPWADTVGDRLILRTTSADIVDDFCSAIGMDATQLARIGRQNTSLSVSAAHLLRHLNERSPLIDEARLNPLYQGLHGLLGRLVPNQRKLTLSADQIAMVQAATSDGNEAIRAKYFPERQTLFAPAPSGDEATAQPTLAELTNLTVALTTALRAKRIAPLSAEETERLRALLAGDTQPVVKLAEVSAGRATLRTQQTK